MYNTLRCTRRILPRKERGQRIPGVSVSPGKLLHPTTASGCDLRTWNCSNSGWLHWDSFPDCTRTYMKNNYRHKINNNKPCQSITVETAMTHEPSFLMAALHLAVYFRNKHSWWAQGAVYCKVQSSSDFRINTKLGTEGRPWRQCPLKSLPLDNLWFPADWVSFFCLKHRTVNTVLFYQFVFFPQEDLVFAKPHYLAGYV